MVTDTELNDSRGADAMRDIAAGVVAGLLMCAGTSLAQQPAAEAPPAQPATAPTESVDEPEQPHVRPLKPILPQKMIEDIGPAGEITRVTPEVSYADGPVTDAEGNVYFVEAQLGRVQRLAADGTVTTVATGLEGITGLARASDETFFACLGRTGQRVVSFKIPESGLSTTFTTVVSADHEGKPLNRPNDIALAPDGGLYFTDSGVRATPDDPNPRKGIYYVSPAGEGGKRSVTLCSSDVDAPSGLELSPNGSTLFVVSAADTRVLAYSVQSPGTLGAPATLSEIYTHDGRKVRGASGVCLDASGNVFIAVPASFEVLVLNAKGTIKGRFRLPEKVTGVAIGGPEGRTLYVTAQRSVFAVPLVKK
jgi:gluconolactonase